jgi:lauroyl/myristoyl acyltransferase
VTATRPPFGRGRTAARLLSRVIAVAVWIGCRLPVSVAHGLAWFGGHVEWAARPGKRAALATNLAHTIGARPGDRAVRRLVRREIVNEARRSADLLWALGRPHEFLETLEIVGGEHAVKAANRGSGVVLIGLHLGGWELGTAVPAALLPVPTTALVADDWLAWSIEGMRAKVGLGVIPRSAPVSTVGMVLRRGEALVVLGDDAWGRKPRMHTVRFLDASAELPSGGITMARLYGAALVGFSVLPLGPRRWRAVLDEPILPAHVDGDRDTADRAVLQQFADRWTALLRAHPEHWSAAFRVRWQSELPPVRRAREGGRAAWSRGEPGDQPSGRSDASEIS